MPNFVKNKQPRFQLRNKLSQPELTTLQFLFQQNSFSDNTAATVQLLHDHAVAQKVTGAITPKGFNAQLFMMYKAGLLARTLRGKEYAYYLPGISEYKEAIDYHANKRG